MMANSKLVVHIIIICSLTVSSCIDTKKAINFRGQPNAEIPIKYQVPEPLVQSNDILSVLVSSSNVEASAAFNSSILSFVTTTNAVGTSTQTTGYLVDREGMIDLVMVGKVRVSGLSSKQIKDTITNILVDRKLLVDPIVSVRILTFKVTVIGEVEHPTVLTIPSEKVSLVEALGLVGDMTIYAQRNNVLLIRDENGQRITRRIDLNNSELLSSPYYYLKSNDVVYVEPNKIRIRSSQNVTLYLSVLLSLLSFGIVLLDHTR